MSHTETLTDTDPVGTQERAQMTECDREHCHTDTAFPVTVQVANVQQQWCPDCVYDELGLSMDEYERQTETPLRYVTPATVAAFCIGALGMLLIASVIVV